MIESVLFRNTRKMMEADKQLQQLCTMSLLRENTETAAK